MLIPGDTLPEFPQNFDVKCWRRHLCQKPTSTEFGRGLETRTIAQVYWKWYNLTDTSLVKNQQCFFVFDAPFKGDPVNRKWSTYLLLLLLLHPLHGLFSRTTRVSQYQKGKTNLDLNEARDGGVLGWQWGQLDHMQTIYSSLRNK